MIDPLETPRGAPADPWAEFEEGGDQALEEGGEGAGPAATGRARGRGAPPSSGASTVRGSSSPPPPPPLAGARPPPPPPPPRAPDVVATLIPVELAAEEEEDLERALAAERARGGGLPVPVEVGDDRAVVALKNRLARLHLSMGEETEIHRRALEVLDEVASGEVKVQVVTKEGEVVETDLHPQHRVSAARAILGHAASLSRVNGNQVKIGNAQILAAGDLIAQVDPDRLRAAMKRLRSRRGSKEV